MARQVAKPSTPSSPPQRTTRSKAAPENSPPSSRKAGKRGSQPAQSTASTPQKSRPGATSGARAAGKSKSATATRASEPEPVVEVDENQEENSDEDVQVDAQPQDALNNSNLSGDTAVAQPSSTQEIERLKAKAQELITSLPELNDDASRILRVLAPRTANFESTDQLLDKLRDDDQFWADLERRREPFKECLDPFCSSVPEGYIRVDMVLEALFGADSLSSLSSAAVWRPDDILYKANLARAVSDIMARTEHQSVPAADKDSVAAVARLVDWFYLLFFSALVKRPAFAGESSLISQTFSLVLNLRSRHAINRLLSNEWNGRDKDPVKIVYSAFTDSRFPANAKDLETLSITGWHIDQLQDSDGALLDDYKEPVLERCNAICQAFTNYDGEAFLIVDQVAPWRDLQIELSLWAKARVKEIDAEVSKQQGAEEIASSLDAEVQRRRNHPEDSSFIARLTGLDPRTMAKAVGQMSKTIAGSKIIPASMRRQPDADNTVGENNNVVVDNADDAEPASARATPRSRGRPRKRLIDRQLNAQKIDFVDSQQSQSTPRTRGSQITIEGDPVTPDDGFQRSSGTTSAKKRADNRRATTRPEIDPRLQQPEPSSKRSRQQAQDEQPTPRKRARVAAGSYAEDEPQTQGAEAEAEDEEIAGAAPPSTDYASVNENARLVTAMREGKTPQKRTFWDTEECDALIYYIGVYGTSWSKIKEMDNVSGRDVLMNRDQVALKDKARNMKFDYLKAGVELPRNFQHIALDKKLKAKLFAFGVDADA